ncbi:MAG: hypothetical protein MK132_08520 [Lentisphaerales bacterium]|nr:hypothetical protein [Lentisphaerales bacterium]
MNKTFSLLLVFAYALNAQDKPNILFIYTDDQIYRTVSCYEEDYGWV